MNNILCFVQTLIGFVLVGSNPVICQTDNERPVSSFVLKVENQNDVLKKFYDFSEKEGFAIRVAPTNPGSEHYLIQMFRDDLKIIGLNDFDTKVYKVFIYINNNRVDQEVANDLLVSLKSYLR